MDDQHRVSPQPAGIEVVETKSLTIRRMLTVEEAAEYLGVKKGFLDKRRGKGRQHESPPWHEIGGAIRYSVEDLDAYLAARRRLPLQK